MGRRKGLTIAKKLALPPLAALMLLDLVPLVETSVSGQFDAFAA